MENKVNRKKVALLPGYFKVVGLLVVVTALAVGIVCKSLGILQISPYWWNALMFDAVMLGFSFIAMSRDKIEDEFSAFLRLRSIAWAFSWVILLVVLEPFTNLLFTVPPASLTAHAVVLNMLIGYIVSYYFQKRAFA